MGAMGDEFEDYRNNFFLDDSIQVKNIEKYFKNGLKTFISIYEQMESTRINDSA